MSKDDELIMCFRKDEMIVNGEAPTTPYLIKATTAPGIAEMRRRGDVEKDTSYIQPIPYTVIIAPEHSAKSEEEAHVLVYCRSKKGGEERLHNQYSVGIGGHINMEDVITYLQTDSKSPVATCVLRELGEELGLYDEELECDAIMLNTIPIYKSDEEVSSVHIGILHFMMLAKKPKLAVEDTLKNVQWIPIGELRPGNEIYENMESWSKIVLDDLADKLAHAASELEE